MYRVLLVLLSIVLFSFSMPGSAFPWLTWFVFTPAIIAVHRASPKSSAFLLYFAMLGIFLIAIAWLQPAIIRFTELNNVLAIFILILFCMILSIPYALVGWFISYQKYWNKRFGIFIAAASFTVIVSLFPTSLPGNIAHSLYVYPSFIQLVSIGGIPLLFFIVIVVNLLLAKSVIAFEHDKKKAILSLMQPILVITLVYSFGVWKLDYVVPSQTEMRELSIGFIQPKLEREDAIEQLYTMSEQLVAENPSMDLLVWPEIPARFSYAASRKDRMEVNKLIAKLEKPMLIVSGHVYGHGVDPDDPLSEYYNAAHLINQERALTATYSKQVLVPFFEFVPGESYFPVLRKLFPNTHRYISGDEEKIFKLNEEVSIIPLICYETVFPDITRRFIKEGGNIIINLSNDIWLGQERASEYHFALGMFRTIEYNVPWVRVTNSGISGVVSASGIIDPLSLTAFQAQDARVYQVRIPSSRSLYATYGDMFLHVLVLIFLFALFRGHLGSRVQKIKVFASKGK